MCASHCKSLSILKVLRVPLSFSLFNFQGPTHFLESFLSVFTEPLSTVRESLYHALFRLSTLFSKFFLNSLKASFVLSNFSVVCAFLKRLYYYTRIMRKVNLFLNFINQSIWRFLLTNCTICHMVSQQINLKYLDYFPVYMSV